MALVAALVLALFASLPSPAQAQPNDEDMPVFFTDDEGTSYLYDPASMKRDRQGYLAVDIVIARSDLAAHAFMRQAHKRYLPYFTYAQALLDCRRGRFLYRGLVHFTSDQTPVEQGPGSSWIELGRVEHMDRLARLLCAAEAPGEGRQPAPLPPQAQTPSPSQPGRKGGRGLQLSSGTGFLINSQGMVLTNWHVVENARQLTALMGDKRYPLKLVAYDSGTDLALLSSSIPAPRPLVFRAGREARHGEDIITLGYPMPDVLSLDISTTTGIVSSLAGAGNDPRILQFTAPIQPGNSGGPLLDRFGSVVGVVVAKLDALEAAERTKDIPQNVNFAIKTAVVREFLNRAGVRHATQPPEVKLDVEEIVASFRNSVVLIVNER